jgi:hypothetical protein
MPWTWRYEKSDGTVISTDELQEAIFGSQGDAESWLGENWRALLSAGVDQVTLLDDARAAYGPMSLHPED